MTPTERLIAPVAGALQVYAAELKLKKLSADGYVIEVHIGNNGKMASRVLRLIQNGTASKKRRVTGPIPRKRPLMPCAPVQRMELEAMPAIRKPTPAEGRAAHGRIGRAILEMADPPMMRLTDRECVECGRFVRRVAPNVVNPRCGLHPDQDVILVMDDDEEVPMGSGIPDPRLAEIGRRPQRIDRDAPIRPGLTVMASDRENYGRVIAVSGSRGTAVVEFVNNARQTRAEVEIPLWMLAVVR